MCGWNLSALEGFRLPTDKPALPRWLAVSAGTGSSMWSRLEDPLRQSAGRTAYRVCTAAVTTHAGVQHDGGRTHP